MTSPFIHQLTGTNMAGTFECLSNSMLFGTFHMGLNLSKAEVTLYLACMVTYIEYLTAGVTMVFKI